MNTHQKALIVKTGPDHTHGLDELNVKLGRGWRVVQMAPLGGAGVAPSGADPVLCLAALVIVERTDQEAAGLMEQVEEEEVGDEIDEIIEGNGSGLDV